MGIASERMTAQQRADIAETCFAVTERKNNRAEKIGLCPFHDEQNPSFSYNFEKDVFHCLGCGVSGDLIKLWGHAQGFSDNREAFKAFCHTHGIGDKPEPWSASAPVGQHLPPKLDAIYNDLPELPKEWMDRICTLRGWTPQTVSDLGIRLQTCYQAKNGKIIPKKPDRIAIPIFDGTGAVRNMRLYRPGPAPDGSRAGKMISWASGSGDAMPFPARPEPEGTLLLCEGEPDTICALSRGFNAITMTASKMRKWSRDLLSLFKDRDVVVCFDADQAGQIAALQFSAPALAKVARSVRILEWPEFMGRYEDGGYPEKDGQDLTDFFVRHRKTSEDLAELMASAIIYHQPEAPLNSEAADFFETGVNGRMSFRPRLLANRLLEKFRLNYDHSTGLLYRWSGTVWERVELDIIKKTGIEILGTESQMSRVSDAAEQAKVLSAMPSDRAMNDQLDWVTVKNGALNLKTLELKPHDPEHYASVELPVVWYPREGKTCGTWLRMLEQNIQTPEVIMQLQEFFGYCLDRRAPPILSKCMLLLGDGSDGKSTVLYILRQMVGVANCASVGLHELEDQFLRSSLYGKSVNISTEVGSKAIESQYFKAITSGDTIQAAFKHKDTFDFEPFCKLIFAANKLPRVLDNSDGNFRRWLPIRFKHQWMDNDPDIDPHLKPKLMDELSEIFQWSVVGLHRVWEQGRFTDCTETQGLMQEYRRSNSPVVAFLEDACELDASKLTAKDTLYKGYRGYCDANGYSALGRDNFFKELFSAQRNLTNVRRRVGQAREYAVHGIAYVGGGV
ncbi:phage/plasmid primase, P4 family [Desulfobotulus sp. H1]|uniref:Phage/plasmid primase, P4 family n=1 Tax=Desulfobotulus pelophilus TaxID=2823377 RepID=A0ABT3ND99_9BACT|nr:phage/plasmid primase, P4 family [Desulfobotulus pelophilus]MCW7755439.1 phage/plasmid primase, P4 family [Desulfobotulus pelophilus]